MADNNKAVLRLAIVKIGEKDFAFKDFDCVIRNKFKVKIVLDNDGERREFKIHILEAADNREINNIINIVGGFCGNDPKPGMLITYGKYWLWGEFRAQIDKSSGTGWVETKNYIDPFSKASDTLPLPENN